MKKFIGIFLAVIVFGVQLMLIPGAGLTWDEPSSFFFGRSNINYWLTGNRAYLTDFKSKTLFTDEPFFYLFGEDVYPTFPFVVASGFSWIFAEHLHLLPVIDAHHMGEVFLASIGVAAFYGVAVEVGLTIPIAAATTLLLAFYPTIIGEMRADPKDIPLMSMLIMFMYCLLRLLKSLTRRSFSAHVRWALATGVTLGLSVASKPTAPLILVPIVVWFIISISAHTSFRKAIGPPGRLIPLVLLVGFVGLSVFFFIWPWLWDNPVGNLTKVWQFFHTVGFGNVVTYMGGIYNAGFTLPWTYPYAALGTKTPIELLLLAILGMGAVWASFRRGNAYATLAFFWFWLLIMRFLLPGMVIYDKVRHFIDAMPGFFLLVGFGLQWFSSLRPKKIWGVLTVGILLFAFGHELFIMARFYPYEPTYYNALIGGIKTVSAHKLFDTEQLASSVKEGIEYVNRQPGNPSVYVCQVTHLAYFYAAPHVTVVRYPEPDSYVLIPNDYAYFAKAIAHYSNTSRRVHTVTRDGGDLLYIYHSTGADTYYCGPESDTVLPAKYDTNP
ncbi:MAG: glycosyltransferase family 39 protein [Candidatus Gottesmanbacteria bacterium]|nr:glycosyltransferase family 39 protein [Candidatus Gottesmanbacteria bacterium]